MKRTMMVIFLIAAVLALTAPLHAQDEAGKASSEAALCSLQLAGVNATEEQLEAFAAQASRIEAEAEEFLSTNSLSDLQAACPAQAELFAAGFEFAERGANASSWTAQDQLLASVEGGALAAGFDAGLAQVLASTNGESCAFKCKRERDACIKADGCAPGYPCFCCVPCNLTWMACMADCCLPG